MTVWPVRQATPSRQASPYNLGIQKSPSSTYPGEQDPQAGALVALTRAPRKAKKWHQYRGLSEAKGHNSDRENCESNVPDRRRQGRPLHDAARRSEGALSTQPSEPMHARLTASSFQPLMGGSEQAQQPGQPHCLWHLHKATQLKPQGLIPSEGCR